jgi:uncharacterized membrane protein (UPF0182 family)
LLSDLVNSESKILYDRAPRERVKKVAPWLTLDGDPYPAVVNGKIVWIIDAYTTTNGYPYSERTSLGEATADSITASSQFVAAQQREQVNYIRNSVKATVDAYDGTVTLFAWDEADPVLQTWSKSFPGTVEPRSDLKGELLEHVRYPEDIFKVQRELFSRYHVTDPQAFYSGQDFWAIPDDPTRRVAGQAQPPYYLTIKMPGTKAPTFSLTSTFSPNNRQTLSAFMAVSAEPGDDYGTIRVLQLPRNTTIPGPVQVQNNIESDPEISSQLSLLRRGGSEVETGNLLTLPVGGGLLYVEPIYVRATQRDSFPLLRKVAVAFGNNTALDDSLEGALAQVFDGTVDTGVQPLPGETPGDGGGGATPQPTDTLEKALDDVSAAYAKGQAALRAGDLAAFAKAQEELGAALKRVDEFRGVQPTPSPDAAAASRIPRISRRE